MATYFISDIHGEYKLFCKLLEKISFSQSDTMIILGDIIDKGDESIKLAKFLASQSNMQAIIGNHEHAFLQYVDYVLTNGEYNQSDESALKKINEFFPKEEFCVDFELIEYFYSLPYYIENDNYICVHAGVELDKRGKILPLQNQDKRILVNYRRFKDDNLIVDDNRTVLFGHTPCHYDNGVGNFIKYKRNSAKNDSNKIENYTKIRLDCGTFFIRLLGCLRLEDMKEFYVTDKIK